MHVDVFTNGRFQLFYAAEYAALQIATFDVARLLKQEKELGSIAVGKRADFLLVEGSPIEHISDIRRCRLVMKNGTLYNSGDL